MASQSSTPRKGYIGSPQNFWLHHTTHGFDLTHPSSPSTPIASPTVTLQTTTSPITVDPSKSALVVIDMQNFFLSPSFGRKPGPGHTACENLVKYAVPAARKAGVRVVWLNWGLTDEEVRNMPPAVQRAFGFSSIPETEDFEFGEEGKKGGVGVDKFGDEKYRGGHVLLENGKNGAIYRGLGAECGEVENEEGKTINAGRLLMRDTWNAALYAPLSALYEEGSKLPSNPDVWIHKNRMSGMWGATSQFEDFVEKEGIKTLFFSGVNTDQCVGGTFTDAFSKGYDCVLLGDGCGTTSPEYAQQCFEFNAAKTYGFCLSCEGFAEGVEAMKR